MAPPRTKVATVNRIMAVLDTAEAATTATGELARAGFRPEAITVLLGNEDANLAPPSVHPDGPDGRPGGLRGRPARRPHRHRGARATYERQRSGQTDTCSRGRSLHELLRADRDGGHLAMARQGTADSAVSPPLSARVMPRLHRTPARSGGCRVCPRLA